MVNTSCAVRPKISPPISPRFSIPVSYMARSGVQSDERFIKFPTFLPLITFQSCSFRKCKLFFARIFINGYTEIDAFRYIYIHIYLWLKNISERESSLNSYRSRLEFLVEGAIFRIEVRLTISPSIRTSASKLELIGNFPLTDSPLHPFRDQSCRSLSPTSCLTTTTYYLWTFQKVSSPRIG